MSTETEKDLFDSLDRLQLPQLTDDTSEESTYIEPPIEAQHDHKEKEATALIQETARKVKAKNARLEIENSNLKKLAEHREAYSWAILAFVICTVIVTFYIVIQAGTPVLFPILENDKDYKLLITNYVISDQVIMTLLGTTLAQVIGILWLVVKWLYPSNNNHTK
ncbi:MAG: hypothetical protein WCW84_05855 [Sulfurimonas sp.]